MVVTTSFQVSLQSYNSRVTCIYLQTTQTLFAVPMTCESCVQDITGSLFKLSGIQKVEANLKDQLVTIEGTGSSHPPLSFVAPGNVTFVWNRNAVLICIQCLAAPSAIVAAIEATGRDAILRGSGTSNSELRNSSTI